MTLNELWKEDIQKAMTASNVLSNEFHDAIMHYGMPRRSGRYPYGSGENPYQHANDFYDKCNELRSKGMSDAQIAEFFDLTTSRYKNEYRLAKDQVKQDKIIMAQNLDKKGFSRSKIAEIMGEKNESTIRGYLNENNLRNRTAAQNTAEVLKQKMKEKGYLDVGAQAELALGVSRGVMDAALTQLDLEGYQTITIKTPQATNPKQMTTIKLLCPINYDAPEYDHVENLTKQIYKDAYQAFKDNKVMMVGDVTSDDNGQTFRALEYPASIDSSRVYVRYAEEGGTAKDGTIELRRNVPDLSLGNNSYAQVRILLDDKMYAKGMALYSDNIPEGYDMVVNTNRKQGTPYLNDDPNGKSVFKKIKDDPVDPFGALIKPVEAGGQYKYIDPKTGEEKLGAINKLRSEGDWDTYSTNLAAQFLSKQPLQLIDKQLKLSYAEKESEYQEIASLSNPTLKKEMLAKFAEECDGAQEHMKAAALPRQSTKVILPLDIPENEIYAPTYKDGEKVVLIRYPHAGTMEIPTLTVNNNNVGRKILGNVKDAVGISPAAAERLSGADFDGDTAIVIPVNSRVQVKTTEPLAGLKGFDNKTEFPYTPGMNILTEKQKGKQMGIASNLITDMSMQNPTDDELCRAIKYSMVVIDAPKHKLDWKRAYTELGISALQDKYQAREIVDLETGEIKTKRGASTLISRMGTKVDVPETVGQAYINEKGKRYYDPTKPEGTMVYAKESGKEHYDKKTGEMVPNLKKVPLVSTVTDLNELSRDFPQERLYADYGNKLKALSIRARKEILSTGDIEYSKDAETRYKNEVESLKVKLESALANAPKERMANREAVAIANKKREDYNNNAKDKDSEMSNDEYKKIKQKALNAARIKYGSKKPYIEITDSEWEAIQSGAIKKTTVSKIFKNTKSEVLYERALPKTNAALTSSQKTRIQAMLASGNYTQAEIAEACGVSVSTVSKLN